MLNRSDFRRRNDDPQKYKGYDLSLIHIWWQRHSACSTKGYVTPKNIRNDLFGMHPDYHLN